MEMNERNKDAPTQAVGGPFAWLVQSTTERNPPHGWAVHMFNGQQVRDAVPVYLAQEVDRLRSERDDHARWRQDLANELDQCERSRDAIGRVLQKRESDLMLLRNAVEKMMAPLGYHGEISARDDRVQAVMDALAQIDAMNDKCQGLDGGDHAMSPLDDELRWYVRLMKLAHELAMEGRGQDAQDLRVAATHARNYRWLRDHSSPERDTYYLCSDRTQARFNDPSWVDRHIETDIANYDAVIRARSA